MIAAAPVAASPTIDSGRRLRAPTASKSIALSDDEAAAKDDDDAEPALRERSVSRGRSQPRAAALFSALTDRPARSLRDRLSRVTRQIASLRLGVGSVLLVAVCLTLLLLALGACFGFVRFGSSTVAGAANPLEEAEQLQQSPSSVSASASAAASASASSLLRQIRLTLGDCESMVATGDSGVDRSNGSCVGSEKN